MSAAVASSEQSRLPLDDHPLRRALNTELHLRSFPIFGSPARILQIIMLSGEHSFAGDRDAAERLCLLFGKVAPLGKHFVCDFDEFLFVWERHTEFASYTFIWPGPADLSFNQNPVDDLPSDWLSSIPGRVLRATQIVVLDRAHEQPNPDLIRHIFPYPPLVSCMVGDGRARIWSSFQVHPDGLGRLLIQNDSLLPSDLSRTIQHLQELGNYRNMALLGLPEAQNLAPQLSSLEARLGTLTDQIAEAGGKDETLLSELSMLSAELARLTAKTRYRMSATQAYAELASDRLRNIGVSPVEGYPTLADFTERRLVPAMRTCLSFTRRLDDLSNRAALASSLLRTRVETTLEQQSHDLLDSMNKRTDLQFRLQQTVEGLSVVAISYYAVGLFSYSAKALHYVFPTLDPTMMTAASVPAIIIIVALLLFKMKRHH